MEILSAPLLAGVPDFKAERLATSLPVRDVPTLPLEAYRFAVSSLETAFTESVGHIALVASSKVGQGKTTTTANLALAAASLGYKVLAIDADFGNQDLTRLLDTSSVRDGAPGLTDLLDGRSDLTSTLWKVPLAHPLDLQLMVRGTPVRVPSETLQGTSTREAMSHLRLEFDLILIDGPPFSELPMPPASFVWSTVSSRSYPEVRTCETPVTSEGDAIFSTGPSPGSSSRTTHWKGNRTAPPDQLGACSESHRGTGSFLADDSLTSVLNDASRCPNLHSWSRKGDALPEVVASGGHVVIEVNPGPAGPCFGSPHWPTGSRGRNSPCHGDSSSTALRPLP